jgi:hypothetical protein
LIDRVLVAIATAYLVMFVAGLMYAFTEVGSIFANPIEVALLMLAPIVARVLEPVAELNYVRDL